MKVEISIIITLLSAIGAWIFGSSAVRSAMKNSAKEEGQQLGEVVQQLQGQSIVLGEIKNSIGDVRCVVDDYTERIVRLEAIVDLRRSGISNEHLQR